MGRCRPGSIALRDSHFAIAGFPSPEFHLQQAWQMHNAASICVGQIEDWIPKIRE
jgi:hypothetical protein